MIRLGRLGFFTLAVLIASALVYAVKYVLSPKGEASPTIIVLALEILVLAVLLSPFVIDEIKKLAEFLIGNGNATAGTAHNEGASFSYIGKVLFAFAGSMAIFVAVAYAVKSLLPP